MSISTIFRWLYALLLLLIGLVLIVPGGFLVSLGGSPYYVLSGLALVAVAFFIARRSDKAIKLYGLILGATVRWALFEAGLDLFALLPRRAAWLVVGLWFLAPWLRASMS